MLIVDVKWKHNEYTQANVTIRTCLWRRLPAQQRNNDAITACRCQYELMNAESISGVTCVCAVASSLLAYLQRIASHSCGAILHCILTQLLTSKIHNRSQLECIGVTYPYLPLFGLGGTVPPTFQDTGEKFVVLRGDLSGSNYTITVFGRGSARTPSPESSCFVSVPKHAMFAGGLSPQTLTHLYFFLLTCATICFLALFWCC